MSKFEVEVEVTSAIAWYEVEADTQEEAEAKWHSGRFLSVENIDGEAVNSMEDFDDDSWDDRDDPEYFIGEEVED